MRFILLLVVLCLSLSVQGQRRASNWYFGNKAGLNFNNGVPNPLLDGELDTIEGCSSISDEQTGALLFYTEGRNIWNRNHEVMPNGDGLLGSFSSTQSALVIPKPGSTNLFYIFTSDVVRIYQTTGFGNGFNYSIVNMNLNGGLGDVVDKNIELLPEASEKVTAVNAANGEDYWVITHHRQSFYAYKITAAGVAPAVVSTLGPDIDDFFNIRGSIKASPDGSKLAIAHLQERPIWDGVALLYDFDNQTGVVSNERTLGTDKAYYGAEFSPNTTKLYFSAKRKDGNGGTDLIQVEQYDLEASNIAGSRFVVGEYENSLPSDLAGALQVAVDGKIYHGLPGPQLSVLRTPNLPQYNADYRPFAVNLGLRSANYGLPPYVQSFFESIVTIKNLCFEDMTTFMVDPSAQVTAATWNFGDPASGANNTSTAISPSHVFTAPGLYTVTVDFEFENRIPKRFIEFVEISPILEVNEDVVLFQCDIDGLDDGRSVFNLNQAIPLIVGDTQSSNPDFDITANFFRTEQDAINNQNRLNALRYQNTSNGQLIYARVFENSECVTIAPLVLEVVPMSFEPPILVPICDTGFNEFTTIVQLDDLDALFDTSFPDADIQYYDTADDALLEKNAYEVQIQFNAFQIPDVYYRVELEGGCVTIGYAAFDIKRPPELENENVFFCQVDGGVTLSPPGTFNSYEWDTGETSPEIVVTAPGNYELTVSNGEGCTDTMLFIVATSSTISINDITVNEFQQSNEIIIDAQTDGEGLLYSVDGGLTFQNSPRFENLTPGYYNIIIRDAEACSQETARVLVRGVPRFFTPNTDGTNDYWQAFQARSLEGLQIEIYDRFGKLMQVLSSQSRGWDGTYNGETMPTAAYWYKLTYENTSYTGHFMLIRR